MSTTDGGNTWQTDLLDDFYPDLCFYSIDVLENKKAWVTGLSDLLLVKQSFATNFHEVLSHNIRIFPNPITAELNIQCEEKITTLILCDYMGNVIFTYEQLNQKNVQINMAQQPPGIYFLKINQKIKKIIKI